MNATDLTKALAGRWSGHYGMARCPAHKDRTPSLKIEDGARGILLWCYTGCDQTAVIDALRHRGLWPGAAERRAYAPPYKRKHDDIVARTEAARKIWREAQPAEHSLVEKYLSSRGITVPVPPTLRYHPGLLYHPSGLQLPGMVAAVQAPDRSVVAVHRTFLKLNGSGKAGVRVPKMTLGALGRGAVRLGPAGPVLGLAEGVETGLSAMQLFNSVVWCGLGSRLDRIEVPPEVVEVQVFADNGVAGHRTAERAAEAFAEQGRRAFVRYPPDGCGDWNDHLNAQVAA